MALMCPCKGCTDRTITCHSVCKRYDDWKIEHKKMMNAIRYHSEVARSEHAAQAYWEKIKKKKRGWG